MTARRRPSAVPAVLLGVALHVALAAPAAAHPLAPSLLEIVEAADGALSVRFKTPRRLPVGGSELVPELPARCSASGPPRAEADDASVTLRWSARCDAPGLVGGTIAVRGLAASATNALVRIALRDGRHIQAVLHGGAPSFVVPARPSLLGVFRDYAALGAQHIASGLDHLLFVFGLMLLASTPRKLLATVTAFTAGHSVTLSLATLGVVRFPSGLIEMLIAATILTLAVELGRNPPDPRSALRRRPWAASFGFGLLHGFGFAGALAQVGLPQQDIPLALFSFNAGIEAGQLAFVVIVLVGSRLAAPRLRDAPAWLRWAPVYGMGGLAAYWCLDRAAALV